MGGPYNLGKIKNRLGDNTEGLAIDRGRKIFVRGPKKKRDCTLKRWDKKKETKRNYN